MGGDDREDGSSLNILVAKHPLTKAIGDMAWVADLEKESGVKITWQEVSADWDQKKSTLLAAGDLPDLMISTNVITDSDLATYGSLFEDLSDDMEALPNVADMFEQVDGAEAMATQADGALYALPDLQGVLAAGDHPAVHQQEVVGPPGAGHADHLG